MRVLSTVLVSVTWAYLILLIMRMVMSWVFVFAPNYRPAGMVAAGLELAFSATDPPLRLLRRLIPPLRVGNFALDLAFIVLFVVLYALIIVWRSLG